MEWILLVLGLAYGAAVVGWAVTLRRKNKIVDQGNDLVAEGIAKLVVENFGKRLDELRDIEALTAQKLKLETELTQLRRDKDQIELTFKQKERSMEHAAGLLKKELDAELAHGRTAALHEADRKVLEVERAFNKKQMDFAEERFKTELQTLHELVATLTERLPDVSASLKVSEKRGR